MASAGNLIAVLLFWVIIGITWAMLTENVIDLLPSMFPLSVAEQPETWSLLLFVWRISIVLLGFGTAISILGNRGTPGVIASATIILIGMFLIIFSWAAFYEIINITIPSTFSAAFGTATNARQYAAVYNTSLVLFMLGLALLSFLLSGNIGRARRKEYIVSGNNRDTTINKKIEQAAKYGASHIRKNPDKIRPVKTIPWKPTDRLGTTPYDYNPRIRRYD